MNGRQVLTHLAAGWDGSPESGNTMIVAQQPMIDLPDPAPPPERDHRGRFARNNRIASQGGRARAAALTPRRRRAIARKGYRSMVARHFAGDRSAQRRYLVALAIHNYEVMAAVPGGLGLAVRRAAGHPGPIQDWRAAHYTSSLLYGDHRDVDFRED